MTNSIFCLWGKVLDPRFLLNSKRHMQTVTNQGRENRQKQMRSTQETIKKENKVKSCPTLCNPMGCSLPGSSIHGIFQARVLEWVAISFFRGSSWPRDRTQVFCIAGRHFTIWATWEIHSAAIKRGPGSPSRDTHKKAFEIFCGKWGFHFEAGC